MMFFNKNSLNKEAQNPGRNRRNPKNEFAKSILHYYYVRYETKIVFNQSIGVGYGRI